MTEERNTAAPALWHRTGDPEEPVIPWWLGGAAIGLLFPRLKPVWIDQFNCGEVRVSQLLGVPPLILASLLAVGLLALAWWLPDKTLQVESNQGGSFRTECHAGKHTVAIDQPVAAGGVDAGPTSLDHRRDSSFESGRRAVTDVIVYIRIREVG